MNLRSRAEGLTLRARDAAAGQRLDELAAQSRHFEHATRRRAESIAEFDEFLRALPDFEGAPSLPSVATELKELKSRRREVRKQVLDPAIGIQAIQRSAAISFGKTSATVETKLRNGTIHSWRAYVEAVRPAEAAGALPPASGPGAPQLRRRLEAASNQIDALRAEEEPWAVPSIVEEFLTAATEFTELWDQYAPLIGDIPVEVRQFLDAVRAGGAALDLLSVDVLKWLDQHGESERLQVTER